MRVVVDWQGAMQLVGETGEGHRLAMDGPPEMGGVGGGPRPMEMVLLGLGGCSAIDVVHILERGRRRLAGCRVTIDAERAGSDPKVFTKIHLHFRVSSPGTPVGVIERAVGLSADKYCSVARMLASTAEMTHSVEVED